MSSTSVYITYRTVKVGWCIRKGDLDSLRSSAKLSFLCWGGTLNPYIVVDDSGDNAEAMGMIQLFRPDILIPVSPDDAVLNGFIAKFPHLNAYFGAEGVLRDKVLQVLDISHPLRKLDKHLAEDDRYKKVQIAKWDAADPLADLLMLSIGQYPDESVTTLNYEQAAIREKLGDLLVPFTQDQIIPSEIFNQLTPANLVISFMKSNVIGKGHGVFIGDCTSFDDLIAFWNLRSLNRSVLFYDPKFAGRLSACLTEQIAFVQNSQIGQRLNGINIYVHDEDYIDSTRDIFSGVRTSYHLLNKFYWTRINLDPPELYLESTTMLGNIFERSGKPRLSFELKDKPFYEEPDYLYQKFALSIRPILWTDENSEFTFDTIHCPEMNQFYASSVFGINLFPARSEEGSIAILTEATKKHIEISAINKRKMVEKFFFSFGLNLEESRAGVIAKQIFRQMGGPQGSRVFKIEGVRSLLNSYKPDQWFLKQAAIEKIDNRDPQGRPQFSRYEDLAVEYIEGTRKRTSKDAFRFLLKKQIFRPGINLDCENCRLQFWVSLDDLKSKVLCTFCGANKDVAVSLMDAQWSFRKSGLFASDNNQEGAIPVLVSVQQLDASLSSASKPLVVFSSLIKGPSIDCESDFIAVTKGARGVTQVLLAECKNFGGIEEADLINLNKVAKLFPEDRYEVFILLSKFCDFSPEEIQLINRYQHSHQKRIIAWSKRELEPYDVYGETKDAFIYERYDKSLNGLAQATDRIYLNPVENPNKSE